MEHGRGNRDACDLFSRSPRERDPKMCALPVAGYLFFALACLQWRAKQPQSKIVVS